MSNEIVSGNTRIRFDKIIHTTDNRDISGKKVFLFSETVAANIEGEDYEVNSNYSAINKLYYKSLNSAIGDIYPDNYDRYLRFDFKDKNNFRLGGLEYSFRKGGNYDIKVFTLNIDGNGAHHADLKVGYDLNNIAYAQAPSTSTDRSSNLDIITRDFIPKDTRIVHTTGDELISGTKCFLITSSGSLAINGLQLVAADSSITRYGTPSENKFLSTCYWSSEVLSTQLTADNYRNYLLGCIEYGSRANGSRDIKLLCCKPDSNSYNYNTLVLGFDENGESYAKCPSTSTTRTGGTDIVTRNFIPNDTRIVHTTGDEEIAGQKRFTNQYLYIKRSGLDITTKPSSSSSASYCIDDKNNKTFASYGATHYTDGDVTAYVNAYSTASSSTSLRLSDVSKALYVTVDNTVTLGRSNKRWKQLYAGTTTISTSDERHKDNIEQISDTILDIWPEVEFDQFQFKKSINEKGSEARYHVGVIAQRVKTVFEKYNLNPFKYGLLCYDEYDASPEELDEHGNVVSPAIEAGNIYSIRYEELLCVEAAYQRRENKRLKERISSLEDKIALLEEKLNTLLK